MSEWIKNLKVGDMVIISSTFGERIAKVDRITPAGNIGVGDRLFLPNGLERGGNYYHRIHLREATPEAIKKVKIEQTISKAYQLMRNAKNITFEQATEIIKILSPQGQENIT